MRGSFVLLGFAALGTSAWAQQPTSADLVGAVMKSSVTDIRVQRRGGLGATSTFQTDWTIEFVSEKDVEPGAPVAIKAQSRQEGNRGFTFEKRRFCE